jgi:hypothetical protein
VLRRRRIFVYGEAEAMRRISGVNVLDLFTNTF